MNTDWSPRADRRFGRGRTGVKEVLWGECRDTLMRGLSAGVLWATLLTWWFALERGALGLQFYLRSGSQVCLTEELLTNSHVSGEVLVVTGRGAMEVNLTVKDETGTVRYSLENIQWEHFEFETRYAKRASAKGESGDAKPGRAAVKQLKYSFCLHASGAPEDGFQRKVSVRILEGSAAGDHGSNATKNSLQRVSMKLTPILQSLQQLADDFETLHRVELELGEANERVVRTLVISCVGSVAAMFVLTLYQMYWVRFRLRKIKVF